MLTLYLFPEGGREKMLSKGGSTEEQRLPPEGGMGGKVTSQWVGEG